MYVCVPPKSVAKKRAGEYFGEMRYAFGVGAGPAQLDQTTIVPDGCSGEIAEHRYVDAKPQSPVCG